MSRDTLEFLVSLLNQVQLSAGAPDFEETVQRVLKARRELVQALVDEQGRADKVK